MNKKESTVQEQKDKIDELQMKIDTLNENMNAEINDIKAQYDNAVNNWLYGKDD